MDELFLWGGWSRDRDLALCTSPSPAEELGDAREMTGRVVGNKIRVI